MVNWVQILVGVIMAMAGAGIIYVKVREFRRKKDPIVLKLIENIVFLEVLGGFFLVFFGVLTAGQAIKSFLN